MATVSLSAGEKEALFTFIRKLKEQFGKEVVRIILFGSRAKGEGFEESDLDVAVLLKEENFRIRKEIYNLASDIFLEHDIDISPFVMSEEKFDWLKDIERGIALEIEKEGILLHTSDGQGVFSGYKELFDFSP